MEIESGEAGEAGEAGGRAGGAKAEVCVRGRWIELIERPTQTLRGHSRAAGCQGGPSPLQAYLSLQPRDPATRPEPEPATPDPLLRRCGRWLRGR